MDFDKQQVKKPKGTTVVRSELVHQLTKAHPNLSGKDVDCATRCLLNFLTDSLVQGQRIELRGFGSFSLHHRKKRIASHPKTGATIFLPAKSTPHFKPGKSVRDAVDESNKEHDDNSQLVAPASESG